MIYTNGKKLSDLNLIPPCRGSFFITIEKLLNRPGKLLINQNIYSKNRWSCFRKEWSIGKFQAFLELLNENGFPIARNLENTSYNEINQSLVTICLSKSAEQSDHSNQFIQDYQSYKKDLDNIHSNDFTNIQFISPTLISKEEKYLSTFLQLLKNTSLKLRVHDVGQANFSQLFAGDDPIACFDLGYKRNSISFAFIEKIEKTKGIIVISHFDDDHINLVQQVNDVFKNCLWYLPQFPSTYLNHSTQVLMRKLVENNTPCIFVDTDEITDSTMAIKLGPITINHGNVNPKEIYQSTEVNSKCLICTIQKNNHTAFLPADALYLNFPQEYTGDFVLIPHHSCQYDDSSVNFPNFHFQSTGIAFLCNRYQGQKHYCHPNKTQYDTYLSHGYEVRRFSGKGKAVSFDKKKIIYNDKRTKESHEYYDYPF